MWMKFRLMIVGKTIGLCVRVYNEYDALLGFRIIAVGCCFFPRDVE